MDEGVRAKLAQYLSSKSKKRAAAAISPEGDRPVRQSLVAFQPQQNEPSSILHYTLGGRAGKYTIPSQGSQSKVLLVRKLREHLLSLSKSQCSNENYRNGEHTLLCSRVKAADNFVKMFDGERCKFSRQFL